MNDPNVKATIIVPLWNHRAFVARQLESLLRQWRSDLEMLVIDDASTDEGFEVARAVLAGHPAVRATLMRNERTMSASLPNVALRQAAGSIIIQADGDDVTMPDRIARVLRCFDQDPKCHLVTSNALRISTQDTVLGLHDTRFGGAVFADPMVATDRVGDVRWLGATGAFRREVFEAFPPIDDELCGPLLDLLTPFRAMLLGTHHYIAEPLVGWRQHGTNVHRTPGVLATGGARAERYSFLELTILAQRVRDAQAVQARRPDPELHTIIAACNAFFFASFTDWTRMRTRLDRSPTPAEAANAPSVSPIPPIATIYSDAPEDVALDTRLGRAAALSPGFARPERWGIWTDRLATLTLRLGDDEARCLVLRLRRRPDLGIQRVRILLVGADWVEIELRDDVTEAEMPLTSTVQAGGSVTVVLSSPNDATAGKPRGFDDHRSAGVGLVRVTAVSAERSERGE